MSVITVDGDLVHYEVLGRGRPVILIHGWIGSWRYWVPTMRQLQLKYRVYAMDLFGYGDSGKNPACYNIPTQVHMLDEFMQQLGVPKAAMIGHGLGAQVLLEFARLYPDRVARMMLSSAPLFDPGGLDSREPEPLPAPVTNGSANRTRGDVEGPLASKGGAQFNPSSPKDKTIARRPAELEAPLFDPESTIASVNNRTIANPRMIDRERLRLAALERGAAAMRGESGRPLPLPPLPVQRDNGKNPLREALADSMENLLLRCFKRTDAEFEKLQADVIRTDQDVIKACAQRFDAGETLDALRQMPMPVVVVHGEDDPLIPPPGEAIWDYITLGKDDTVLPFPLPGVRHFPMLEHDLFQQLVGTFLEIPDISKIELKERWRRRSR